MNIKDFSNEILTKIFSNLTSYELAIFHLSCRQFNIFENNIKTFVQLKLMTSDTKMDFAKFSDYEIMNNLPKNNLKDYVSHLQNAIFIKNIFKYDCINLFRQIIRKKRFDIYDYFLYLPKYEHPKILENLYKNNFNFVTNKKSKFLYYDNILSKQHYKNSKNIKIIFKYNKIDDTNLHNFNYAIVQLDNKKLKKFINAENIDKLKIEKFLLFNVIKFENLEYVDSLKKICFSNCTGNKKNLEYLIDSIENPDNRIAKFVIDRMNLDTIYNNHLIIEKCIDQMRLDLLEYFIITWDDQIHVFWRFAHKTISKNTKIDDDIIKVSKLLLNNGLCCINEFIVCIFIKFPLLENINLLEMLIEIIPNKNVCKILLNLLILNKHNEKAVEKILTYFTQITMYKNTSKFVFHYNNTKVIAYFNDFSLFLLTLIRKKLKEKRNKND